MALIARIGIVKLGYNNFGRQLCKVIAANTATQVAFITSKAKRVDRRPRLKPFDYLNKEYGFWAQLLDPMIDRLDENSKIIVVEGPIAAGKSKVGQKLAEELDMLYLPPPTFDEFYITPYGYDLRSLDDRLSPRCQSCDVKRFLTNPRHPNVPLFQFHYFQFKLDQYISALAHLLSTGQGIVLNRSFYSDYIFARAMINAGYMRPQVLQYYATTLNIVKPQMMRPHLIIYLDVPVDAVKEKIKKRGISYEVNSEVLTTDYLTDIENLYKLDYLKDASTHSHVLIYDWTDEGDVTTIVEDIEPLNFDDYDKKDEKMKDWRLGHIDELREKRGYYHERVILHKDYFRNAYDIPELMYTAEECEELENAYKSVPGYKYDIGYNPDMNDKGILWKNPIVHDLNDLRSNARDFKVIKEELKKLKANAMG